MLESRRCYGYGMVSPAGYGYDYIIKKDRYSAVEGNVILGKAQKWR